MELQARRCFSSMLCLTGEDCDDQCWLVLAKCWRPGGTHVKRRADSHSDDVV